MEEQLAKFEKGVIVPDAEPRIVPNTQKELDESVEVKTNPLQTVDLRELLQKHIDVPLKEAYNTVHEFVRVIETGEIKEAPTWYWKTEALMTDEEKAQLDKRKQFRQATLCQYISFTVKGNIRTRPNDEYWVKKIAKWYQKQIDWGYMENRVLGVGAIDMAMWCPTHRQYVSLNPEGTKYIASRVQAPATEEGSYKYRPATHAVMEYGGINSMTGQLHNYTIEEIEKFETRRLYYLFAFPTLMMSAADKMQALFAEKRGVEPLRPKEVYNLMLNTTWFVHEGEIGPTEYDVNEQFEVEKEENTNPHNLPQDVL